MKGASNHAESSNRGALKGGVTLGEVVDAACRFWTRLSAPLVGTWFILSVLLYAFVIWQGRTMPTVLDVLVGGFQITSVREFLVILLITQAISLVRVGLYLPARLAYEGERPDARAILRMSAGRFPTLANLTIKITGLFVLVGIVFFLLNLTVSLWVVLPLAFALEPAKYYASAHRLSAADAIRHSLEIARRHWLPIFVVFGAITCISAALPELIEAACAFAPGDGWTAAEYIGRVSAHIGADFVAFMASCGLYFALEESNRSRGLEERQDER